jgi:hypothetical protein
MKQERGFIALISVIILSAILLLAITSSGLASLFSRFNLLDAELKERSEAAADACTDIGLLQLATNPSFLGGVYTLNTLDECRVGKVTSVGGGSQYQFFVQATSSKTAVTNLQVVADQGDFSIVSWREIATY